MRTCSPLDGSVPHGYIESRSHGYTSGEGQYVYLEGVVVTFACYDHYKLPAENTGQRKCLASGLWSGRRFHCGMSALHVQCNMQTQFCII